MYFNIKYIGKLPGPTNEFERSLEFETGEFERPKFDCTIDYTGNQFQSMHVQLSNGLYSAPVVILPLLLYLCPSFAYANCWGSSMPLHASENSLIDFMIRTYLATMSILHNG